jgi:8-oxo-dGTP pyrophosphatase MutT (NUDIX family)
MDFNRVIKNIDSELKKPLPGKEIQLRMSSMQRIRELMNESQKKNGVKSSVLILLYPNSEGNEISTVLIQRPSYEGVHGGQISLPGGRSEKSDKDLKETALRETKEEIGIDPYKVITLGILTELYIPPSNYIVLPFIGYTLEKPIFHPDPQEVAGIIEISLADLRNDQNIKQKEIYVRPGFSVFGPCFEINGFIIWGATAMILSEFREILIRINI